MFLQPMMTELFVSHTSCNGVNFIYEAPFSTRVSRSCTMQTFVRKVKEKTGNNNIYKTKHKFLSQLAEGPSAT